MEEETKVTSKTQRDKLSITGILDNIEILKEDEEDQLRLSEKDYDLIVKKVDNCIPHIEKFLQETPSNVNGVYFSVIISLVFIIFASYINPVQDLSQVSSVVKDYYEYGYWDKKTRLRFSDISDTKDLKKYIRNIVVPSLDNPLGDYNYLIGLRMTFKITKLTENKDSKSSKVFPLIRKDSSLSSLYDDGYNSLKIDNFWPYSEGYKGQKGFIIVYLPTSNDSLLGKWREAEVLLLDQTDFESLTIEFVFQNSNIQSTLYYSQSFEYKPSGRVNPSSEVLGSFIEKFEHIQSESLVTIILLSIYCFGLLWQVYKIGQVLRRSFKVLLERAYLDLVWYEYIQLTSAILALVSICLFCEVVFSNIGKLKLPLKTEDDFAFIINYCRKYRTVVQVTALTTLIIVVQMILILRFQFPSFGILFDTILVAKTYLTNFISISILLLFGFVFWGNVLFGPAILEFSTIDYAFRSLFHMSISQLKVKEKMGQFNTDFSLIFIVSFETVFVLILITVFLVILMKVYEGLKVQRLMILEAKAEILAEYSKDWFEALTNLVFFRVGGVENDALKYEELLDINRDALNDEERRFVDDKLKMYEKVIIDSSKLNLFRIFKANYAKISSLGKQILYTKEQTLMQIKTKIQEIIEKKIIERKKVKQTENLVDYNFTLICNMFIYILFIAVSITAILLRIHIEDSYELYQFNSEYFTNKKFGDGRMFSDIKTQDQIYEYLSGVILPYINKEMDYQNIFVDDNKARVTIQMFQAQDNKNALSKAVLPVVIRKKSAETEATDFRGDFTKILYHYSPSNSGFKSDGGYIFYLGNNTNVEKQIDIWRNDKIMGFYGYYLAVEWVTYNANLNFFSYNFLKFDHNLGGEITQSFHSSPIELDYFKDKVPVRGVLEILVLLFDIYFIAVELKKWISIWNFNRDKEKEKQRGYDALRRILKQVGERASKEKGCYKILTRFLLVLKALVKKIFSYAHAFIRTFKIYIKADAFNMINLTSTILSLLNLSQILNLYQNSFIEKVSLETITQYDYFSEFYHIEALLVSYKTIACFNFILIFIRLLQYFKFSKHLSMLSSIFNSAKLDLFFYLIMFALVLFGYTLMGYLLLGHTLPNFGTLQSSLISCYLLLIGRHVLNSVYETDKVFGSIFQVTFIIFFTLVLLNMFIVIIISHFEMVKEDFEEIEDKGFFSKIFSVILAKKKGKKYLNENPNKEAVKIFNENKELEDEESLDLISFHGDANPIESLTPVSLMKTLETVLYERSTGKLQLFKMNLSQKIRENENNISFQGKIAEFPYMNIEIWKDSTITQKLQIWRTFAKLNLEFDLKSLEKAYFEGSELPEGLKLQKTLKKMWDSSSLSDKLGLWIGKIHFSSSERTLVWNSISFSDETFGLQSTDFLETWSQLKHREKFNVIRKVVKKYSGLIKRLKNRDDVASELLERADKIDDFKMVLWLGLTTNSFWINSLILNEANKIEAEVMEYLNLCLNENSIFALEEIDDQLEQIFDGKIFDCINSYSEYLAELHHRSSLNIQINRDYEEVESLKDYYYYVKKELANTRGTNSRIWKDIEKYDRRKYK